MTTASTLPILDLAQLDRGEDAAFGDALLAATHDIGFFYLVGHGIQDEMLRSPHFRGYTRTGGELTQGRVDWREQIDLGAERAASDDPAAPGYACLEGPNLWPEDQPALREVFGDWSGRCAAVAMRLMRAWAVALGSPADVFDHLFRDRPSTLIKLVRYPGREERGQGVGAHKDPGILTLLLIEPGQGGLEVEHDGGWIEVPPVPGAFVVNIGELMEFATDGYLKATNHRVVSPPPGQTRLSIPFFLNPALDSTVTAIDLLATLAAGARGVSQDPANVISGTFGENMLKARLRAHQDVAAAHHPDLIAPTSA